MLTHNKTNLYRKIALSFTAVSIAIALGIFYLSYSWATVVITPKADAFSASSLVDVIDTGRVESGDQAQVVKGAIFDSTLDGQGTFSTQSTHSVEQKVTGRITLVNKGPTAQPLKATTRLLSSDGVLFRMRDYAMVPAQGQVETVVVADKTGDVGNFDTTHFILPGLNVAMQDRIYGQGFVPGDAGKKDERILTEADIKRGEETLIASLKEKFSNSIDSKPLKFSAKSLYKYIGCTTQTSKADHALNKTVDQFSLSVKVKCTAVLFDKDEMYAKILEKLKEQLAANQELIQPAVDDLTYRVEKFNPGYNTVTMRVNAQAKKIIRQDARIFDKAQLIGLSKKRIIEYFKSYDDVQDVKVTFYPFWVVSAPTFVDHINILVKK